MWNRRSEIYYGRTSICRASKEELKSSSYRSFDSLNKNSTYRSFPRRQLRSPFQMVLAFRASSYNSFHSTYINAKVKDATDDGNYAFDRRITISFHGYACGRRMWPKGEEEVIRLDSSYVTRDNPKSWKRRDDIERLVYT